MQHLCEIRRRGLQIGQERRVGGGMGRISIGTYSSLQTENERKYIGETSANLQRTAIVVICGDGPCWHCVIQSLLFLRNSMERRERNIMSINDTFLACCLQSITLYLQAHYESHSYTQALYLLLLLLPHVLNMDSFGNNRLADVYLKNNVIYVAFGYERFVEKAKRERMVV